MNENFILNSDLAKKIYLEIKDLPIIDFHNHLSPKEIYENKNFTNISDMWLKYDHYKWRLMRFSGYNDKEENKELQFKNYISSIEHAYLNPLLHWTKMELNQCFNIDMDIIEENAEEIYRNANKNLKKNPFGPQGLLESFNVETLCTTDDINDDLKYHSLLNNNESFNIKVLPTFRPDSLLTSDRTKFINTVSGIQTIDDFKQYLNKRVEYFHAAGCRLSDHGISILKYIPTTNSEAEFLYSKRIKTELDSVELSKLNSFILSYLMKLYVEKEWTVQLHLGAYRNSNTLMYKTYGKDAGYDSISNVDIVGDLNLLLDDVNQQYGLPRMVIYPIDKNQYESVATICANFSSGLPGKIQLGAAWWFHDHITGIERQLEVFGEYLNLSHFLGMVTDSRSFLSFVRHDYFRRVLADFLANKAINNRIPMNDDILIKIAKNISYYNSKRYLNL